MVITTPRMANQIQHFLPIRPAPTPNGTSPAVATPPQPRYTKFTHFEPNKNLKVKYRTCEEYVTDDFCVDRESVQRKFGWATLGDTNHIPVLYRQGEKYCAVAMVEKFISKKYLNTISDNIYADCTNIPAYYATIPECTLLNEINGFHCNNTYIKRLFKEGDVLVKYEDALAFYKFLVVCHSKLFGKPCEKVRCGFLTMNGRAIVPYVVVKNEKLVPRFYLDEMDGLNLPNLCVKGWELSYLKFCFKVHGIREEFCKTEECSVLSMTDLMKYLEPEEKFEEWMPVITKGNAHLFRSKPVKDLKPWFGNPTTALPISGVKYTTKTVLQKVI